MPGNLVVITTNKLSRHERFEGLGRPPIELLQSLVGGYVEPVRVRWDGKAREGYVDEDGIRKNLMPNWTAMRLTDRSHFIVGTLVIWVPDHKESDDAAPTA